MAGKNETGMIDVAAAAAILGYNKQYIRQLVREGKLKAYKRTDTRYARIRFDAAELIAQSFKPTRAAKVKPVAKTAEQGDTGENDALFS